MNRLLSGLVLAAVAAAMTPAVPASAGTDQVHFTYRTDKVRTMNQAYENLVWDIAGVYYSEDRYEWCSIELENVRTREQVASDFPDEYEWSGTLKVYDYYVAAAGGPGKHELIADCYWAGEDRRTVWIRLGTRTHLERVEGDGRKIAVTAKLTKYNLDGDWVNARGARAQLQQKRSAGWTTIATARTNRKGMVRLQPTSAIPGQPTRVLMPRTTRTDESSDRVPSR